MALLPPQTFTPSAVYGLPFTHHRQRQDVPAQRAARHPADAMGLLLDLYRDGQTGSDAPAPTRQRAAGDVATVWRAGRRSDGRPVWDCIGTYATSAATAMARQLAAANPGTRFVTHAGYDEPAGTAAVKPAPAPTVHRPAPAVTPAAVPTPQGSGPFPMATCVHESSHAVCGWFLNLSVEHLIVNADATGYCKLDNHPGDVADWNDWAAVAAAGVVGERRAGFPAARVPYQGEDAQRIERYRDRLARDGKAMADPYAAAARVLGQAGAWRAVEAVAADLHRVGFLDGGGFTASVRRAVAGGV